MPVRIILDLEQNIYGILCQYHALFVIRRIIIDGPEASTVFSGHEPLIDNLYTLTNHYISGKYSSYSVIRRGCPLQMILKI